MDKLTYMLLSIKNGRYKERGWLLSMYGILPETTPPKQWEDLGLKTVAGKLFVNPHITAPRVETEETIEEVEITDYVAQKPVYGRIERVALKAGDMLCIKKDLPVTTYGLMVLNTLLIEYPYQGLAEYINGEITPKAINKLAANLLKSENCTVEMHLRFEEAASAITALSQTGVPSATRKSVTPNPLVAKHKGKLLKEYDGRLHDPAAVTELQDKIAALDEEYLKGDPHERFNVQAKSKVSRLRTRGMYGSEQDFYDESKIQVLTNSLDEGWTAEDIPQLANVIRAGSYNRGSNTALGGSRVKETARIFQNYTLTDTVCGTKNGHYTPLFESNYKDFIGRYLIGTDKPLTESDLKKNIGGYVHLLSPGYCESPGTTTCKRCVGDIVSNSNVGLTALMTEITSSFLGIFMKLNHAQKLETHKYNYKERIT